MDAPRILDLLGHFDALGIPVWLDGGWAIDALLGEQTRPHDDLDLVARLEDAVWICEALAERGYRGGAGEPPLGFELVDQAGHQVDVHPVSFRPNGDGVYRMADGRDWIYAAAGFRGTGHVLDQEVPCRTPEVMMVCHTTGYLLDEIHQRDVAALGARYGIPLPDLQTTDSR
jgi:lincosamide nucleotidyltransferase A/C/D/E